MEMTREAVLAKFSVDEYGIIRDPGKFEGEPLYVPVFWESVLDGSAEDWYRGEGLPTTSVIELSDEDRAAWPELGGAAYIALEESNSGFVSSELWGVSQYETALVEYETEIDSDSDSEE